jgi:hypothetical protein
MILNTQYFTWAGPAFPFFHIVPVAKSDVYGVFVSIRGQYFRPYGNGVGVSQETGEVPKTDE